MIILEHVYGEKCPHEGIATYLGGQKLAKSCPGKVVIEWPLTRLKQKRVKINKITLLSNEMCDGRLLTTKNGLNLRIGLLRVIMIN